MSLHSLIQYNTPFHHGRVVAVNDDGTYDVVIKGTGCRLTKLTSIENLHYSEGDVVLVSKLSGRNGVSIFSYSGYK